MEGEEAPPQPVSTQQISYNDLASLVQSHSGVVSQLIGKKTTALVTTSTARSACTQKVRKALKKSIPIVDLSWVEDSIEASKMLPLDEYRREEEVEEIVERREQEKEQEKEKGRSAVGDVSFLVSADVDTPASQWSEPLSYGCSCVCHENNPNIVTDCDWCTDCNVNEVRKGWSEATVACCPPLMTNNLLLVALLLRRCEMRYARKSRK